MRTRTPLSLEGRRSEGGQGKYPSGELPISSFRTVRRKGRGQGATLHSSTPRDVFFVVREMACATDRTGPLSLVLTLDALVRRACRNGAPILRRLAEAKFILVLRDVARRSARALSLSLFPLFFPLTLERLRESWSLAPQDTYHAYGGLFFREIRLDELSVSRYYCARGAARQTDRRLLRNDVSRLLSAQCSKLPMRHVPSRLSITRERSRGENLREIWNARCVLREGELSSRPFRSAASTVNRATLCVARPCPPCWKRRNT